MKLKYILLFILLAFFSCCGDEKEPNIDEPNIDEPIELSRYSIESLAQSEHIIDVLSDTKNLSILDENPEIASGWWTNNGRSIRIKIDDVGETSIFVNDRSDKSRYAEIKVVSGFFSGDFVEVGDMAHFYVLINSVVDESIKKEIEEDLAAMARSRSGTTYSFDKETKTVVIYPFKDGQKMERVTGNYEWNKDSLYTYIDGTTHKYGFAYRDENSVVILPNLQERYMTKYPDIFINSVVLQLYLQKNE